METQKTTISRRKIIRQGFLLSASLFFAQHLKGAKIADDHVWLEIADYARWCPTVHNLQPHKLKITSPTEAILYYDSTRLLPIGDPDSIFATVAMGVFIEHLSIAANPLGLQVEVEITDPISVHHQGILPFAKLRLVASVRKESLSRDLIKKRRTSRGHYSGKVVDSAVIEKINAEAGRNNYQFHSSSEKEIVDFVIDMNRRTLFEDISVDADRKELDALFRYSQHEAETHKDGLWSRCMGFPGELMKMVFRHHEQWEEGPLRSILNGYYKSSFKGTRTIGWFTGNFTTVQDHLNAGRMLARNWLLITQENLYIHPFGSLITNVNAYRKINAKLHQPGDPDQLWMMFRMGHSDEPTRSYRLDLKDILI